MSKTSPPLPTGSREGGRGGREGRKPRKGGKGGWDGPRKRKVKVTWTTSETYIMEVQHVRGSAGDVGI